MEKFYANKWDRNYLQNLNFGTNYHEWNPYNQLSILPFFSIAGGNGYLENLIKNYLVLW